MMLLASAFLIGVALSRRYNVFILAPASFVAVSAILVIGVAAHGGIWENVIVAASTIFGLQLGYFAGTIAVAFAGGRPNIATVPSAPVENMHDRNDVVHFRKYRLVKTQ